MYRRTLVSHTGSRRRFFTGVAALALAPAFAPGSSMAQHLTADPTSQPVPGLDTASLAARTDDASHLTVEVGINGAGPYRFVVDTGAERSVIADNVAAALKLPSGKAVTVSGLAGKIAAETAMVETLSFGPFSRHGLDLPILPRHALFADGYLGLDAINGSRVTFDFHNHALRIEQPRSWEERPGLRTQSTNVRAQGTGGRLRVVGCLVDNIPATAFIDTGAEISVGNPALKAALLARKKNLTGLGSIVLTGITGGQTLAEVIPVTRIDMEELTFTNGALAIADVPDFDDWNLRMRPALLIGLDYLRQFASISIDYRSKEIHFELSQILPHASPGVEIGALT